MKRISKSLAIPLLIAIVCVSLLGYLQWLRPSLLVPVDIAAGDYLFVREDGPNLGHRPLCDEIVLVLIDRDTVVARNGELPSHEEDLRLYELLFDAGARVVADTHMIAAADDSAMEDVRSLLDGMRDMRADGSLMRDIWTPIDTSAADRQRWAPCIAPTVTSLHPTAFRMLETRLSPLAVYMHSGPVEAAPLRIVRAYKGLAPVDLATVDAELQRCGIFAAWAERDEEFEYRFESPPFYRLGDISVHWHEFPSNTTLVPRAAFWVSYDAAPSQFRRFSYSEVLDGNWQEQFADKIVIIGTDAQYDPTQQTYTIPSSLEKASIAEVVGASVQTLLDGRFPHEMSHSIRLMTTFVLVLLVTISAISDSPINTDAREMREKPKELHDVFSEILLLAIPVSYLQWFGHARGRMGQPVQRQGPGRMGCEMPTGRQEQDRVLESRGWHYHG